MKGLIGTGQRVGLETPLDNFNVGNIGPFCIFMELCEYFAQVRGPQWNEPL